MKKFILALTFLFTILEASAQTPARQQVDSILNLFYNTSYWKSTIDYMAKLDKEKAQKLQDAILYVANSPSYWPMRHYYLNGMAALKYKEIEGYALLVEEDWIIYNKIGKTYPNILPMEDIRVQPLKPVIYLYPEKQMDINVNLKFDSEELYTWPKVDANLGWSVTAQPDGMLTDAAGNEYPYLFWESKTTDYKWVDFSEGFVIKAEDTENFLRDKLKYLGLNSREFTEFITFWAPRLRQNKYNLIRFETAGYNNAMPITVHPAPESMQRIFMVYKALDVPINLPAQTLQPFSRKGYTVIEWGGMVMPDIIN